MIQIIDGDRGANYPMQSDFSEKGYCLFLNAKNITKYGFRDNDCQFITLEKHNTLRKGIVDLDDIVFTTRGTIGNAAIFDKKNEYKAIRINSGMIIFRILNPNLLLPRYLYFYLISNEFKFLYNEIISGSAQPQLPIKDIYILSIPLPDINAQSKIISELDSQMQVLEGLRKMKAEAEKKIEKILGDVWGKEKEKEQ